VGTKKTSQSTHITKITVWCPKQYFISTVHEVLERYTPK